MLPEIFEHDVDRFLARLGAWQPRSVSIATLDPRACQLSSCGETEGAARRSIADAVQGFLETAKEQGTLNEILQKAGYEFEDGRWKEPELLL